MTDDRMNGIKEYCEVCLEHNTKAKELNPRDVLDLITELEQLRKVVGCMGRGWDYWFISDTDAKANNLDIAKLQKGMGK